MAERWKARVVELENDKLVVDLGEGHIVDLVGIMDKIQLENPKDILFGSKQFNEYLRWAGDGPGTTNRLIKEQKLFCSIPLTQVRSGGRPTKSRRHRRPPRRRRATRRTTRRR